MDSKAVNMIQSLGKIKIIKNKEMCSKASNTTKKEELIAQVNNWKD